VYVLERSAGESNGDSKIKEKYMNNHGQFQGNATKIWNTIFINAFIINLLIQLATNMSNTLSSKFADSLGATPTVVGMVSGIFALTALMFKMVSAPAIDTYNRKYVLLGSIAILCIAYVCYSFSNNIPMLIGSRLLQGTAQAFCTTCCLTIAADSLPVDKMATGIGYFALTNAIAQAISPAIGLKMQEVIGYNFTFGSLAIVSLIAIAVTFTMKMDFTRTKKFEITLKAIFSKECAVPAIVLFLFSTSYCVVNAFLILFAEGQGVNSNIGFFFTIYAVTMLFTRPMIGRLADKYGTVKVLIPAMLCFATSFVLISISTSLPMFLLAGFISAFGYGGCQPVVQAVCMNSVPSDRRGAASCTSYIGLDLGNLVGTMLAGIIAESFGYVNMWRIMISPIMIAMIITILFKNKMLIRAKNS
jgi:MFS family permease